jgi:hypothetical protein
MKTKEKIIAYGISSIASIGAGALMGYCHEKGIQLNETFEASLIGIPVIGNSISQMYIDYKQNRAMISERLIFPGAVKAGLEAGVGFALGNLVGKVL